MPKIEQKLCERCGRKSECEFEVHIGELVACPKRVGGSRVKQEKKVSETPEDIRANYGNK